MFMRNLSQFVLRHKLLVGLVWVGVAVGAIVSMGSATGALSNRFSLPGSESSEVNNTILDTYGNGGAAAPFVVMVTLPDGTTVDSPGVKEHLADAFGTIKRNAPSVRVAHWASTGDRVFVSDDGRTTYGLIFATNSEVMGESSPDTDAIRSTIATLEVAGSPMQLTGMQELQSGEDDEGGDSGVLIETIVGGVGALVVLLWAFGSFLAILPVLMAAIAIPTTFLMIWALTTVTDISGVILFLVSLIGLGVAIDYSLLVVTRWREERSTGVSNEAAVQRAMETAGHSVVFSGVAVAIGLIGLVAVPVPMLRSMGFGGILIPLVSVVVSITLLPVLLATIGPRLDWPRFRRGNQVSHFWERWSQFVIDRRWAGTVVALALLGALIIPAFAINVGFPSGDSLASAGPAQSALNDLQQAEIGTGALTPFEVLVENGDPEQTAATYRKLDGVAGVVAPATEEWRQGERAVVVVIPEEEANGNTGRELLDQLRSAANEMPGTIRVGGPSAIQADFIGAVYSTFPLALGIILIVTFVVLVRAFRSILLPLKAVLLNVLSIGAAYGVIVMFWQFGWGSETLLNIEATGAITNWLPVAVFAFLYGLSMDYEVFILARMREEYDRTGSTDEGIVRGMSHTGRLVTTAAIILFLAFMSMMAVPDTNAKIMATGLATGLLIDATVVRALLVPAVVSLMGDWNWWIPTWLSRFVPDPALKHVPQSRSDVTPATTH